MRRVLSIALMLLAVCLPTSAQDLLEGIDVAALVSWSDEQGTGIDVAALLSSLVSGEAEWDLEAAGDAVRQVALGELRAALGTMIALLAPMLILAVLQSVGGRAASAAALVGSLAVAAQLVAVYERIVPVARGALDAMAALTDRLHPLLAALLAATGKGAGSALFTPTAAMAGGLISGVIARWSTALVGCAAALTIAGHLSERMRMDGLTSLAKRCVTWGLGALLTLFTAILSVQGLLAGSYDGASIQTARFAASSLVPVVGGEVADSLDAIVTSAKLVKNALGVTGVLILAAGCLVPVVKIAMQVIAVRLAAALAEPLASGPAQKMVDKFAGVLSLLLASVIAGALLTVVLIGAALGAFGG